jgi:hypothetical protein
MIGIVVKVQELLSNPEKWTKTTKCQSINERPCNPSSHIAVKWSVWGAIEKCYPKSSWQEKKDRFMEVADHYYPSYDYESLHMALSHEALMFLLKKADL